MDDQVSMTAILARRYGSSEVLELAEVPRPVPAEDEVLIRVLAIGLNVTDAQLRSGGAPSWFDDGPWIWGWDIAGEVVAVPAGSSFVVGDSVLTMPRFPALARAYAQYVAAPEGEVANLPPGVSIRTGAGVCMSGLTALQTLEKAGLLEGHRVMVNGAAGGVGHLALQIAVSRGARVTAVAHGSARDSLLDLGAERFADYQDEDVPATVSNMDIVVDCVGDDAVVACAVAGGVVARVPGAAGPPDSLEVAAALASVRVVRHVVVPDGAGLSKLAALLAEGSLMLEISQTYAFTEVQQAHDHLERGVGRGKPILVPPGAETR